jgi:hypothetical protein
VRKIKLVAAMCIGFSIAGCRQGSGTSGQSRPSGEPGQRAATPVARPAVQNQENVDKLLQDAAAAEQRGDYARAMEIHQQMRAYPEASRPNDLDERIERLRERQQRASKATGPTESR